MPTTINMLVQPMIKQVLLLSFIFCHFTMTFTSPHDGECDSAGPKTPTSFARDALNLVVCCTWAHVAEYGLVPTAQKWRVILCLAAACCPGLCLPTAAAAAVLFESLIAFAFVFTLHRCDQMRTDFMIRRNLLLEELAAVVKARAERRAEQQLAKKRSREKSRNIFVRCLDGKAATLPMKKHNTVADLKVAIWKRKKVPVAQQQLVLSGQFLPLQDDDALLADCNVTCGSTLILTTRGGLRGGMKPSELLLAPAEFPATSCNLFACFGCADIICCAPCVTLPDRDDLGKAQLKRTVMANGSSTPGGLASAIVRGSAADLRGRIKQQPGKASMDDGPSEMWATRYEVRDDVVDQKACETDCTEALTECFLSVFWTPCFVDPDDSSGVDSSLPICQLHWIDRVASLCWSWAMRGDANAVAGVEWLEGCGNGEASCECCAVRNGLCTDMADNKMLSPLILLAWVYRMAWAGGLFVEIPSYFIYLAGCFVTTAAAPYACTAQICFDVGRGAQYACLPSRQGDYIACHGFCCAWPSTANVGPTIGLSMSTSGSRENLLDLAKLAAENDPSNSAKREAVFDVIRDADQSLKHDHEKALVETARLEQLKRTDKGAYDAAERDRKGRAAEAARHKMAVEAEEDRHRLAALHEERKFDYVTAIQEAQTLVAQDTNKYRVAFNRFLAANDNQAFTERVPLDALAEDIEIACKTKGTTLQQPDVAGIDQSDPKQKSKYIQALNKKFKDSIPATNATFDQIAAQCNGSFHVGPAKSQQRLSEKAQLSYKNNLQRVTDYVRLSLGFKDFPAMLKALQRVNQEFDIIRIKNRFSKKNEAAKRTAAYRDVQLICYVKGTKLLVEVQLHLDVLLAVKSKVAETKDITGQTGHDRYISFRQLKEEADHEYTDIIGADDEHNVIDIDELDAIHAAKVAEEDAKHTAELARLDGEANQSADQAKVEREAAEAKRTAELLRLDEQVKRRANQGGASELLPESNFGFGDDASDDEN